MKIILNMDNAAKYRDILINKTNHFCPCKVQRTEENICPCVDLIEKGECVCGLYYKEE